MTKKQLGIGGHGVVHFTSTLRRWARPSPTTKELPDAL